MTTAETTSTEAPTGGAFVSSAAELHALAEQMEALTDSEHGDLIRQVANVTRRTIEENVALTNTLVAVLRNTGPVSITEEQFEECWDYDLLVDTDDEAADQIVVLSTEHGPTPASDGQEASDG